MLAVSFFLKYAFDNHWVGPRGRIAIGLVAGVALMVLSQWLLGRGYRYFSEGIAALGGGVLFLSLYAAWGFYGLIPLAAAFVGMAAVTAALAALAVGRRSQRLALLALAAGVVTPVLLMPDQDRPLALFGYLAVLVACFLAAGWKMSWRWLAPVALAGAAGHFAVWYGDHYTESQLGTALLFATLLFGFFAAYTLARLAGGERLGSPELLLLPANAAWFGLALFAMLYEAHRWWLTGALLALAVVYLVLANRHAAASVGSGRAARFLAAGLALTFATSTVPIRLEGDWIVIAWAIEGAALVWAGLRADLRALRLAGVALLALVVVVLASRFETTDRFLLNHRFAAFAVVVAALAASARWVRSSERAVGSDERRLFGLVGIGSYLVAVWGLSEEVWSVLGRRPFDLEPALARSMGLSLLWAVAAGLLILAGVRSDSKGQRWLGLALLCLVAAKVFVLDLSFLDKAYRIASFLVLGVVLLLVSFRYQKGLAAGRATTVAPSGSEEPS
jgi:uncharacterized membrane protein